VLRQGGGTLMRDRRSVLLGLAIGLLGAGGQLILFHAVRVGPPYLIFPIISLSPAITIALSLGLLKERTGLLGTLSGAAFAHYVLFPGLVTFFASFDSPLMNFQPMVRDTFTQHKHMLLAMILVFQLPTIVLFLARLRLVTRSSRICFAPSSICISRIRLPKSAVALAGLPT